MIPDPTNGSALDSRALHPKVIAATQGSSVGGAIALVLVWILNTYAHQQIPAEVALAIGTILSAALAFIAGYAKAA